jgi:ubiquinone/menaquinone biosynthesis C-methylase UbiE
MRNTGNSMGKVVTKLDPIEGHRVWSSSYDQALNPLLALEQRLLLPELRPLEGQRLLDVGCGTGRWIEMARERGALVAGVDLTPRILEAAGRKPRSSGRVVLGDAAQLPFVSAGFDVVVCSFVLGYLDHRDASIREMARVVRPGGRIIMSDLHPEALQRGWTSSFRHTQSVYEIERHRYSLEQIRAAACSQGLQEKKLIEAHFGEPERPIFVQAGKAERFEELSGVPALFVLIWERPD